MLPSGLTVKDVVYSRWSKFSQVLYFYPLTNEKKIVLLWALMKQYCTKMRKLFHWNICDFDYKKTNMETPTENYPFQYSFWVKAEYMSHETFVTAI